MPVYAILVIGGYIEEQMWPYYYINPHHPEPEMQWNHYEIGGRWSEFWKLNYQGTRAAQAQKFEIDIDGMRHDAAQNAPQKWHDLRDITKGESWISLETIRSQFDNADDATEKYRNQTAIKRIIEDTEYSQLPPQTIDDALTLDLNTYIQAERDRACVCGTHILNNGVPTLKKTTMKYTEWNMKINEMLNGLSTEAILTVVEARI